MYRKTTILPTDRKELARRMFTELVYEQPYVLLVVLGRGPEEETFVERGSALTGREDEPRHVVWARRPNQIEDLVLALKHGEQLAPFGSVIGFATSLADSVRDVIFRTEPASAPSLMRVMRAFVAAEVVDGD